MSSTFITTPWSASAKIYHSDAQHELFPRRGNSMRLHSASGELPDRAQRKALLPYLDYQHSRYEFRVA